MTLRVPRFRSFPLLFSTLLLSSCIDIDKRLGENLIPTDQDLTLYTALFDLPVDSRPTDSLQTNNFFFAYDRQDMTSLFGSCYDPVFGLTEAGTVFQFFPQSYSYGDHPEPVSLTLFLLRKNSIVANQSQVSIPQNIFVHEVNNELTYKSAYNNSLEPQDWNPHPVSLPGQIYFGTDTVRIALSLDFARELLNATQEEKDSVAIFAKRYKGLYVKTDLPLSGDNTGRLNLSDVISMSLKYTLDGADSTVNYFCGVYPLKSFNTFSHSLSSIDPHSSENLYYQGFAGYKPYIDFVTLTEKIQTWAEQSQIDTKKLLLSRAELVFSYDSELNYTVIDQYPTVLYPYLRSLSDSTSYYRPIDNVYASNADGANNRSKYHYSMNITSYLQSLLKKDHVTEEDNTWLMETRAYDDQQTGARYYHYSSYTYPLAIFKGTGTNAKPFLKITYAVLK